MSDHVREHGVHIHIDSLTEQLNIGQLSLLLLKLWRRRRMLLLRCRLLLLLWRGGG
jgi:hypothetical protein